MGKEFKINTLITLRLKERKSIIYIDGKEFKQCKMLLLNTSINEHKPSLGISSIDEAAEKLNLNMEMEKYGLIDPETEFLGHCSNMQAWAENGYDTDLLHRTLAFPLLNILASLGDKTAKHKFKEEIARRYKYGNYIVQTFLFEEGYLKHLTDIDILNGILTPESGIFLEKIQDFWSKYSLIPCFDTIRDLKRNNKLFYSIQNGNINELELETGEKLKSIPKEIMNLTDLKKIVIYIRSINDNPFKEKLTLESVTDLILYCSKKINIPDSFSNFPNLLNLEVHGIRCKPTVNLQKSFTKITSLKSLCLDNVKLEKLPHTIINLKKLNWLTLRHTSIKGISIQTVKNLKRLKGLDLIRNDELKISKEKIKELGEEIKLFNFFS